MGVVDEDTERLSGRDHLKTPGNRRQRIERGLDLHHIDFQRETRANRSERIVNVVTSD